MYKLLWFYFVRCKHYIIYVNMYKHIPRYYIIMVIAQPYES